MVHSCGMIYADLIEISWATSVPCIIDTAALINDSFAMTFTCSDLGDCHSDYVVLAIVTM